MLPFPVKQPKYKMFSYTFYRANWSEISLWLEKASFNVSWCISNFFLSFLLPFFLHFHSFSHRLAEEKNSNIHVGTNEEREIVYNFLRSLNNTDRVNVRVKWMDEEFEVQCWNLSCPAKWWKNWWQRSKFSLSRKGGSVTIDGQLHNK